MSGYFFSEYLERKRKFARLVNKRPVQINAVKFVNPDKNKPSPEEILDAIAKLVSSDYIISISPLGGSKEVAISFTGKIRASELVGKTIGIKNKDNILLDINKDIQKFVLKATIKVHWLPPGQDWEEIDEFLDGISSMKVLSRERENFMLII